MQSQHQGSKSSCDSQITIFGLHSSWSEWHLLHPKMEQTKYALADNQLRSPYWRPMKSNWSLSLCFTSLTAFFGGGLEIKSAKHHINRSKVIPTTARCGPTLLCPYGDLRFGAHLPHNVRTHGAGTSVIVGGQATKILAPATNSAANRFIDTLSLWTTISGHKDWLKDWGKVRYLSIFFKSEQGVDF